MLGAQKVQFMSSASNNQIVTLDKEGLISPLVHSYVTVCGPDAAADTAALLSKKLGTKSAPFELPPRPQTVFENRYLNSDAIRGGTQTFIKTQGAVFTRAPRQERPLSQTGKLFVKQQVPLLPANYQYKKPVQSILNTVLA